jgi:hypothetical protein
MGMKKPAGTFEGRIIPSEAALPGPKRRILAVLPHQLEIRPDERQAHNFLEIFQ